MMGGTEKCICTMNYYIDTEHSHPERDTPIGTVTLPYIRHLSETIREMMAPLGIRTCFRPHSTLRKCWSGWRITHPYSNEQEWCTKSPVAHSQKCTLDKQGGRWNTVWKSKWERWCQGIQPSQRWQSTQSTKCMTLIRQEQKWSTPIPTTAKYVHWRPGTSAWSTRQYEMGWGTPANSIQPLYSPAMSMYSLTVASNYSTLAYHCACEWTATIITSYFYRHHYKELRCHYHLPLLFSSPSPSVTFPAVQMCKKKKKKTLTVFLWLSIHWWGAQIGLKCLNYNDNRHLS